MGRLYDVGVGLLVGVVLSFVVALIWTPSKANLHKKIRTLEVELKTEMRDARYYQLRAQRFMREVEAYKDACSFIRLDQ
jgi:predicted RND superfamily exporter protein